MPIIDAGFEYEPLYYWSKMFCVSPFTMHVSTTRRYFKQSILARVASIVMIIFYIVYAIFLCKFTLYDYSDWDTMMFNASICFCSLNFITASITIVIFILNCDKFINSTNTIKELDVILEKYIKIENSSARKVGFVFIALYIIIICYWIFQIPVFQISSHEFYVQSIIIYPLLINTTVRYQFMIWCLIFTKRFKAINNYLSTFSKFSSIGKDYKVRFRNQLRQNCFKAEDLKILSDIRARLCNCARVMNTLYSTHILFYSGICFIWITMQCFTLVSYLFNFIPILRTSTLILSITWFGFVVVELNMFLWICSEVSFHVSIIVKYIYKPFFIQKCYVTLQNG